MVETSSDARGRVEMSKAGVCDDATTPTEVRTATNVSLAGAAMPVSVCSTRGSYGSGAIVSKNGGAASRGSTAAEPGLSVRSRAVLSNPELVFTYGTLMRGYSNHHNILGSASVASELIGTGATAARYALFQFGGADVPFVHPDPTRAPGRAGAHIRGEVWAVSRQVLAKLDDVEGHPEWHKREKVDICMDIEDVFVAGTTESDVKSVDSSGSEAAPDQLVAWIYFNETRICRARSGARTFPVETFVTENVNRLLALDARVSLVKLFRQQA